MEEEEKRADQKKKATYRLLLPSTLQGESPFDAVLWWSYYKHIST